MTASKPSRPVQILLYMGLALGMVLLLRLIFGGLSGTGGRLSEKRAENGTLTVVEKLTQAAGKAPSGLDAASSSSAADVVSESDKPMAMNPEFMRRAIDLATENIRRGGGPFAAVIVKDGRMVAECGNSVTRTLDPTAHAEVNAIREACRVLQTFDLRGCEIYASCEPCPMCLSAIYWARIDRLYFAAGREDAARAGFDDAFLYREVALDQADRSLPARQLMPEEGRQPFAAWERYGDKVPY